VDVNQTAVVVIGIAIVAVLVLGAAGVFGVTGGTSGSSSDAVIVEGMPPQPPSDGSYGLVYNSYKSESGLNLLGWQIVTPRFQANVGFVPPPGCAVPSMGKLEPRGSCAGVPAWGDISGGGTTAEGRQLVIVSVRVSEACHDALQPGDRWPSEHAACGDDQ
jgi:hypothetical protein